MGLVDILGISLGLAMDAFAVAIASSVVLREVTPRQYFRLSFHFGFFQALMPVIGWGAGTLLSGFVRGFGHGIAFGLLALVGTKMVWEALRHGPDRPRADPTKGVTLVVLAVATSIDALAVGASFAMIGVSIWLPCLVIGLVASALTLVGLKIGSRLGTRFGSRMEVVGGIVLVGIGIRILLTG